MDKTLQELAEQRVASGASSTVEAAIWAITYQSGYVHGRSDGQDGTRRDITGASEGYAAGYERGHKWGVTHPLSAFAV